MFFRRKTPENTTSNAEQAPNGSGAETEYPAFDPEAAKRRIAEYKATHPNAVEDIAKANEMAIAEDPYRTEAADYRKGAKLERHRAHALRTIQMSPSATAEIREHNEAVANSHNEQASNYEKEAKMNDLEADRIGRAVGESYDWNKLSPEAQEELTQKRIAEYKAAHPNAVEDIAKANEMAIAEDPYRTEAADYRKGAKLARDKAHMHRRRQVNSGIHESRGEGYHKVISDSYKEKALNFEKEARINDSEADRIGQAAGEHYDLNRLSPEAQEELTQKRITEYKAAHPNAVDDVEKAYVMATAEDPYRTKAADFRKGAKRTWETDREKNQNYLTLSAISEGIDPLSQQTRSQSTKEKQALGFEANARFNDAIAEERGEEAGKAYDAERANSNNTEEEIRQRRIAEYKAAHPNAIDDIEKAHFMAEAGNKLESSATASKEKAAEAFKAGDYDSAKDILGRAKEERGAARRAEEEAGEFYDQMKDM